MSTAKQNRIKALLALGAQIVNLPPESAAPLLSPLSGALKAAEYEEAASEAPAAGIVYEVKSTKVSPLESSPSVSFEVVGWLDGSRPLERPVLKAVLSEELTPSEEQTLRELLLSVARRIRSGSARAA